MTPEPTVIWIVILAIGLGTFALRFSFLGGMGDRPFPDWALRLLRYTPVAVLPGLVAPLVFLPVAGGSATDPIRVIAAAATIGTGYVTKNALWAILVGGSVFYGLGAMLS